MALDSQKLSFILSVQERNKDTACAGLFGFLPTEVTFSWSLCVADKVPEAGI